MTAAWAISHHARRLTSMPLAMAPTRKKQTEAQKRAPACHQNSSLM